MHISIRSLLNLFIIFWSSKNLIVYGFIDYFNTNTLGHFEENTIYRAYLFIGRPRLVVYVIYTRSCHLTKNKIRLAWKMLRISLTEISFILVRQTLVKNMKL